MRIRGIHVYVAAAALVSAGAAYAAWQIRAPYPGTWALVSFCIVSVLLERSPTKLRVGAQGSTSFVVHIAAGILFGGFWGGLIAAASAGVSNALIGRSLEKSLFNIAQRSLSITSAALLYQVLLDGPLPPSFLYFNGVGAEVVQRELFLFLCLASTYILVNVVAVTGAVSLSNGRPFREVWHLNVKGLVGYDLGASIFSLLVACFYVQAERLHIGPLGLLAIVFPIVLLRRVYGMYHELQASGQELLQVMVKAIEARDPYTSGHSLRVRDLSRAIALELQLPGREIEEVETAALLHDVGKIHEEFAPLLRKETRLTPEETALMQSHAVRSADLVGMISKFRGNILRAVRHHHERWDGEGYPDGVRGREIPLGARIVLIADTIDAMTTDRPYRKRLPLDTVIAELLKCRGTQFDPELVDVAVSSVAVRRQILGAGVEVQVPEEAPRSRKVRISAPFWRMKRAADA